MKTKVRICHICKCPANGGHWILHRDIPVNQRKHDFYVYNFPKLADKEWLYDQYVNKKVSLPILCVQVGGIDLKAMQFMLNYYGIKIRSIKEALNLDESKQRAINTCMKKFGAPNALSKGTTAYNKRNKTVLDRYGVENVFQRIDDFIDSYKGKTKSKISNLNRRVKHVIDNLGIPYKTEFGIKYITEDGRHHWKSYDFLFPQSRILLEVNGDYWHANPQKYGPDTIFQFPKSTLTAKEIWNIDAYKKDIAEKNGYRVIYLWENEMEKMTDEELATFIKNCKD